MQEYPDLCKVGDELHNGCVCFFFTSVCQYWYAFVMNGSKYIKRDYLSIKSFFERVPFGKLVISSPYLAKQTLETIRKYIERQRQK